MYKLGLRTAAARFTSSAGKRLYSTNSFKFQTSRTRIAYVTLGLALPSMFLGTFISSAVGNDTDEDKLAESKAKEEPKAAIEEKVSEVEDQVPQAAEVEGDGEKEQEASSQSAAFNPETGEINWDCPCLGGMADGPCGEEFKEAFACFVYSEAEPKGIDCIKKFENMRTCFRQYPEHYKEELYGDDEDDEGELGNKPTEADTEREDNVVVEEPVTIISETETTS